MAQGGFAVIAEMNRVKLAVVALCNWIADKRCQLLFVTWGLGGSICKSLSRFAIQRPELSTVSEWPLLQ